MMSSILDSRGACSSITLVQSLEVHVHVRGVSLTDKPYGACAIVVHRCLELEDREGSPLVRGLVEIRQRHSCG